ncbi:DUF308 domain-containing protein [Pelagicoccus albus]|uniref:DUF308 domain-containing protein n=1 Tax=Pelagicoccus albus TaxID=415222 RepID=A0A7X1E8M3_9BACT|nr:DUF308 domain-containing protein [Pelagicoccus albus]MBC2606294.1 DUF308 domain-containing protein [Pelagicoccus albus]MBC2606303.1 DUF308 domain-containing protein [Pelagicoccus albus]MBC2606332.1 DUF308 domain-containing protein [Pelagicoccus albus]
MTPKFRYTHSHTFTREEYVYLTGLFSRKSKPLRLTLAILIGVVCLLSPYTIVIGVAILLLVGLAFFLGKKSAGTFNRWFTNSKFLQGEVTYEVNDRDLRISCDKLDIRVDWAMASVWEEKDGWLRISCEATPNLYFRIEELKKAEVYEHVIDLCNHYAVRFNSEDAKMNSNQSAHTTPASAPR